MGSNADQDKGGHPVTSAKDRGGCVTTLPVRVAAWPLLSCWGGRSATFDQDSYKVWEVF
jgi:hypothetical protein